MNKKKSTKKNLNCALDSDVNELSENLIDSLNREFGSRIAYNLSNTTSPTHIKRYISTGSKLLDYAISNKENGGVPEGRITEIFGEPSTGKSHIALSIAHSVQKLGGIVVYIDTENATCVDKLSQLGIDTNNRFVYCDTHCTEEVFQIIESTINKSSAVVKKSNIPILVVWDSVAATSPKAELEGNYDKDTIGLQARAISRALRKITGVIGENNVTFVILNQVRQKIGIAFGDPTTTPGGKGIPFHASVRIRLTGGAAIKDPSTEVVMGISVTATVIKNKIAPPHRKASFDILFGEGIHEMNYILEDLVKKTQLQEIVVKNLSCKISNAGAWKVLSMTDTTTGEITEKKFQRGDFEELVSESEYSEILNAMIENSNITNTIIPENINEENYDHSISLSE